MDPLSEARKLEHILSARERSDAIVRKIVLENEDSFTPLVVERKAGETQLFQAGEDRRQALYRQPQ